MTRHFPAFKRALLLLCIGLLLGTAIAQDPQETPAETEEAPPVIEATETPTESAPAPETTAEPTVEQPAPTLEPTPEPTADGVLGIPTPIQPVDPLVPPVDSGLGRFDPEDGPPVAEEVEIIESRLAYDISKLDSSLYGLVSAYVIGDTVGAEMAARDFYLTTDKKGRYAVIVSAAEGFSGGKVLKAVQSVSGKVDLREGKQIHARLTQGQIAALSANPAVGLIAPQMVGRAEVEATSAIDPRVPAGGNYSEGFDIVNALKWHEYGYSGTGVKVGIIDFGFGNSTTASSELTCLNSYPSVSLTFGGTITASPAVTRRGLDMAEIVCDIAPTAKVRLYKVTSSNSLYDAIDSADGVNDVIIIGADFGANFSPGDGTFGRSSAKNVYDALAVANANGVVIVAAAGNTNNAYTAFNFLGTTATLGNMKVKAGDTVNVSWNDWDSAPNGGGVREDITGLTLSGAGFSTLNKPARGAGDPAHQFTVPVGCTVSAGFCTVSMQFTALSGDVGSVVVQVSINSGLDRTIGTLSGGGATVLSQFGRINRPADSPHVISVGSVCADFRLNFPQQNYSSTGPIYGSGGSQFPAAPFPLASVDVKPDVVGPDSVTVSNNPNFETDFCDGGFRGTQAGAAHVGAMAALLKNNTLVGGFSSISTSANMLHYMRTHSVDLPLSPSAAGYDNNYGAGIPVLGLPDHDYDTSLNPPIYPAPNNLPAGECTNGIVYVGPRATGQNTLIPEGTEFPYQSIMQAIYHQVVLGGGRCVIILPGEYSSPLHLGSIPSGLSVYGYNSVSLAGGLEPTTLVAQNRFWGDFELNNSTRSAAIYAEASQNITVGGIRFRSGSVLNDSTFNQAQLVAVESTDNFTLTRSNADGITSNRTLIEIFNGSDGATISENTFTNNTGRSGASLIASYGSGTAGARLMINDNLFENNRYTQGGWVMERREDNPDGDLSSEWVSMIRSFMSYTDVVNNIMRSNAGETLIQGATLDGQDNHELRILGNVIVDTEIVTTDPINGTGPLIHAFFNRYVMVVNNTIAESTFDGVQSPFSTLIGRGDGGSSNAPWARPFQIGVSDGMGGFLPCINDCGSLTEQWARWDIRGNLIVNNDSVELIRDVDDWFGFNGGGCVAFSGPGGAPDQFQNGARNNWIFSSGTSSNCDASLTHAPFENILDINPLEAGLEVIKGGGDVTAPDYYSPLAPELTVDPDLTDKANLNAYTLSAVPFFHNGLDVRNNLRASNGVDIGAYEYTPFVIVSPIPLNAAEDSGVVEFNIATFVDGGFPPYTASVVNFPDYYGTHCDARFASPLTQGTATQTINASTLTISFCPPRNFHTTTGVIPSNFIPITVEVRDASGAGGQAVINYTITPVNDVALATSLDTDAAVPVSATTTLRMRPFVDLSNNLFFSESSNVDASPTGPRRQVDYDFTYGNFTFVPGVDLVNIPHGSLNTQTGEISFNAGPSEVAGRYSYTVSDRNGNQVTNFIDVNVVTPPLPFDQTLPTDNLIVNNIDTLTSFSWEVSGSATSYDLVVTQNIPGVLTPTIDLTGLTPGVGGLVCTTICTYTIPPVEKQKLVLGDYIWLVRAEKQGLKLDAENGPLRFTINTGRELIVNGSFELGTGKTPANWSLNNTTNDKRKCGGGVGGSCFFGFKAGSTASSLGQKPANYGRRGDTIALTAAIKTANLGSGVGRLVVKVKYTSGDVSKLVLAAPSGTQDFTLVSSAPLELISSVKKYKVSLMMSAGSGKMMLDDVSLVLDETPVFQLLSPGDTDTLVANAAYINQLTWETSASALTYEVDLSRIVPAEVLIDATYTATADSDPLYCDVSVCVLQLPSGVLAELTDGNYIWSVRAANGSVAINSPFNFAIDTTSVNELVANGTFESKTAAGIPKLWTTANLKSSVNVCETATAHPEYQGACSFRFVGSAGAASSISQALSKTGIAVNDELTLRVAAETGKAVAGAATLKVEVEYTSGTKVKKNIVLPAGTTVWQSYVADPLLITSSIKKIKVVSTYTGTSGKVTLDNLSVIHEDLSP